MGQYPLYEALMANQGNFNAVNRTYGSYSNPNYGEATRWDRPRTRDEMISHFQTDWDKLKNFWAANPETAASSGDAFNLQKFNTFDEWKNWFIGQHPTNEIVMGRLGGTFPTMNQPTISQPTTNLPTMNQPLVNQPNQLLTSKNYKSEGGNLYQYNPYAGKYVPISMASAENPLKDFEYNSWLKDFKNKNRFINY